MPSETSDTDWLRLLKSGSDKAVQILWDRNFRLLVGFARQRLDAVPRRMADQEGVACSECLCQFLTGRRAGPLSAPERQK